IIFHAHAEFFEIRGERLHMMEIVSAVPSQVFPRQLASGPGLIKRMAKQIVFGDSCVQLLEKIFGSHRSSVTDEYTGNNPVAATRKSGSDIKQRQLLRHGFARINTDREKE